MVDPPRTPAIEYQYHPTGAGKVAKDYLGKYKGCVQTDGFSGYEFLDAQPDMTPIGCWAHARRRFAEAAKVAGAKPGKWMNIARGQENYPGTRGESLCDRRFDGRMPGANSVWTGSSRGGDRQIIQAWGELL